jgi:chromosome segregation ATPase
MTAAVVTAPPELSREDLVTAVARLVEHLADVAAERDRARADLAEALETACALQQDRDRERRYACEQAELARTHAKLAERFRARFVEASDELRHANERCRDLAVRAHAAELKAERAYRELERREQRSRLP